MSEYTIEVREVVNMFSNSKDDVNTRIKTALPSIFNFDFPIWIESYRPILEEKIIRHFFTREIGLETIELWQFYLAEKLILIMPYYNKLYETTVKDYDYMDTVSYTDSFMVNKSEENKGEVKSSGKGKTTGTETGRNTSNGSTKEGSTSNLYHSDFPQGNVNNSTDYITSGDSTTATANGSSENESTSASSNANETENSNNSNSSNKMSYSEDSIRNIKGNNGTPFTDLLIKYRESLINIDMLIINELNDLFMGIY